MNLSTYDLNKDQLKLLELGREFGSTPKCSMGELKRPQRIWKKI